MSIRDQESERLRQEAYAFMLQGRFDEALVGYDRAIEAAESEAQRELVTIVKADAMIATDRDGPEVKALPAIVMRRRSPRHVYFAAYTLIRRFADTDVKRALFYGDIAVGAAAQLGEPIPRAKVLNSVGAIYMIDSRFPEAIAMLSEAVAILEPLEHPEAESMRPWVVANLGGAMVHGGDIEEGLRLIESVYEENQDSEARADCALDLCYGYLQLDRLEEAHAAGEKGFALATTDRVLRNAHYLLGEIAVRSDRFDEAEVHFSALEAYYPNFPNLRNLLLAVDLCPILNLKC